MKMNNNSIRIRQINEKDLEWLSLEDRDLKKLYPNVPCFYNEGKYKYDQLLKPSLDLLFFRKLCKIKEKETGENHIFTRNKVEYTNAFIVVNMNQNKDAIAINRGKNSISSGHLYSYGIYDLDPWGKYTRYIEYKRSGNAAKEGKHIFIREDLYKDMMDWTWLGCAPKELQVSLRYVEMKAYESLVNSNIKDIVSISPDEILLLDDIEHAFPSKIAKVTEEQGKFSIRCCDDLVTNKVTDGECLLDTSLFEKAEVDSSMMLLRNFFFKSCGFCTDIQGYYRQALGANYKNATVDNYFGTKIKVSKIKMIVTLSSFKVFKFRDYFGYLEWNRIIHLLEEQQGAQYKPHRREIRQINAAFSDKDLESFTYDLWCRKVTENGNIFGMVKNEEEHKAKRNFTYQMLNSMPFSTEDIDKLAAGDIEKLVTLRTDHDAYEAYIGAGKERGDAAGRSYTEDFLYEMVQQNPLFRQTPIYKDRRSNDIRAFKQRLYEGKLSIEADYYTLCSMPWELLQYSIDREHGFDRPVLQKGEVCIPGLPDGQPLTLCRNPHTCASNVVCAVNRSIPEIEKWFGFRRKNGFSNIVVLSPWEWDVMEALNGADFDSDEVLCIQNEIVYQRALELNQNERISAIPHAAISGDKKGDVDMEDVLAQYDTDKQLSGNHIGIISNYVQILNSYYWDSFRENSSFAEWREALFDDIQILSVLTGLEIDKAKHAYSFDALQTTLDITEKYRHRLKQKGRRFKPLFLSFIQGTDNRSTKKAAKKGNRWLDCPMDHLAKKLFHLYTTEEKLKELERTETIPLENIFDIDDYKGCDMHKVENILEKMDNCIRSIKPLSINKADLEWADNQALKSNILAETYHLMAKNRIKTKEMKRILYILLEKDVTAKMQNKKNGDIFLQCLLKNNLMAVQSITNLEDFKEYSYHDIYEASSLYITAVKKSSTGHGAEKQINYAKCNKLFAAFLHANSRKKEDVEKFSDSLKKEKNLLNIAYMLQTISAPKTYEAAKEKKLMSLALLYHVWPEIFIETVKNAKN